MNPQLTTKAEIQQWVNLMHHQLEQARQFADYHAAQAIADQLTNGYRRLELIKQQEEAEAKGKIV